MRHLSKSRLVSFRQCPKRLWLELYRRELSLVSASTEAVFRRGHEVGELAQRLFDPDGTGTVLHPFADGPDAAFTRTTELLSSDAPIFEAGFRAEGAMAFADVLLPVKRRGRKAWQMIEVKSSGSVKAYQLEDAGIQAFVARASGLALDSIAIAHVDTGWTYPGGGDYAGLLKVVDVTPDAFAMEGDVRAWVAAAQEVARKRKEPAIGIGPHCSDPFDCAFFGYCSEGLEPAEYPVEWLPNVTGKLKAAIREHGYADMRDLPGELLSPVQRMVRDCTVSGTVRFDAAGAAEALAGHRPPAWFLDFETVQFAVPIWPGTRPFQQIPFQFSLHRVGARGKRDHHDFLDLTGADPRRALAEALIAAIGDTGPVFAYNAAFERGVVNKLAEDFPALHRPLLRINERMVDLLPVARSHYYHPFQQGSWSIKAVLPAIAPDLSYESLTGVADGASAADAYHAAISPGADAAEKARIRSELSDYCRLDTLALVRLWEVFSGRVARG